MKSDKKKDALLSMIRHGKPMTLGEQARLVMFLATPAILAQLTTTMMQYIDASMVGSMGAQASASIGLMETTMWLLGSICSAAAAGFYVQVSHQLGSNDPRRARNTLRQGIMSVLVVSALIGLVSLAVSPFLPVWLGGGSDITPTASAYFAIVATALPIFQFSIFGAGMLRSSGNMVVPSVMSVVMMSLDVVFNFFLIFPTRPMQLFGAEVTIPGMGMGVVGAAIGTVSAELVAAAITMYILCFRSKELSLRIDTGRFLPSWGVVKRALHISLPMGLQQTIMCSAYVMTTIIIAPLGTFAIAANSFGVIVESLCYMPGYGIADAATSLVGQSLGAKRQDLAKGFARITVGLGMVVMGLMAVIMYALAPQFIGLMSNDAQVVALGAHVLRIECFAEAMFGASIVGYGVCVGAGDTLIPSTINFSTMWIFRIIPAFFLTKVMGLAGFWVSMCIELNIRGVLFLWRLKSGKWMRVRLQTEK